MEKALKENSARISNKKRKVSRDARGARFGDRTVRERGAPIPISR
jgi:hypothetical protein